ncbi:MAG: hypothetical protein J5I41_02220 [Saprospiraceae bacterium]|nr:hypothetical protein [Saprospiraceae bacterium]
MRKYSLLLVAVTVFLSCADQPESPAAPDIRIVERRDTIISIDPATYEETTQIVVTYDTVYVDPVDQ